MKPAEIRDLGSDELQQRVVEMEDQLFKLRMQKSMGQIEAAYKTRTVRRDLARIKTILRERNNG
jgi:large subunit ribosomal protein L29